VFWGFVAIAAYFLITEHQAHVVQYLPFLLLLACPLMHLFHGHGGGHDEEGQAQRRGSQDGKVEGQSKHASGCH
jgi:hypothetical protein